MSDFADQHAILCANELPEARYDSLRMAKVLSALIEALGLSIALAAHGDPHKASELTEGVTARVFEAVTEKASIAAAIARAAS